MVKWWLSVGHVTPLTVTWSLTVLWHLWNICTEKTWSWDGLVGFAVGPIKTAAHGGSHDSHMLTMQTISVTHSGQCASTCLASCWLPPFLQRKRVYVVPQSPASWSMTGVWSGTEKNCPQRNEGVVYRFPGPAAHSPLCLIPHCWCQLCSSCWLSPQPAATQAGSKHPPDS